MLGVAAGKFRLSGLGAALQHGAEALALAVGLRAGLLECLDTFRAGALGVGACGVGACVGGHGAGKTDA